MQTSKLNIIGFDHKVFIRVINQEVDHLTNLAHSASLLKVPLLPILFSINPQARQPINMIQNLQPIPTILERIIKPNKILLIQQHLRIFAFKFLLLTHLLH